MPAKTLARIFQAKFRDALKSLDAALFQTIPPETWQKEWVIDIRAVGKGRSVLKYLAPDIFRVAISNKRILGLDDRQVTFQYRAPDRKHFDTATVPVEEFMRCFLQHVLPHHFVKVRYYGFFHPRKRHQFEAIKELFERFPKKENTSKATMVIEDLHIRRCPKCGGVMVLVGEIQPVRIQVFDWPQRTRAP